MKLAILGADATTLALTMAAIERADLTIACHCELDQTRDPQAAELLLRAVPSAQRLACWEDLLDSQLVDGILVARATDEERRSDQLRKFAQSGMPVLLAHPVVDSMLLYYEIDMIRRDTQAIVVPALVDRFHPAIGRLAEIVEAGDRSPVGKIEFVAIERQLADRSREIVRTQFARDVDLLRFLCGELNQIGAMGTSGEESAYGNLSVQITGPRGLFARWAVSPVEDSSSGSGKLVMTGSTGKATLVMPGDGHGWSLSTSGRPSAEKFSDWNAAATALSKFTQARGGDSTAPELLDAARAVELTETIGRSLARRRTIDLHFEDHSEENTFKGKMAVGGCLLLMLGLGVLLFAAIFEKAQIPGIWLWPWLLAGVFGVFLLLQLLSLAFKR